jgi:hypothetical protein
MIENNRVIWIVGLAGWLLLTPPISGGEDRDQLIATARDGNRAAIASIATMECRYERRPWANTTPEQAAKHYALFSPGSFWRSGEVWRLLRPMGDGTTMDCVVRDGRGLFLRQGGPLGSRRQLVNETMGSVDGVGGLMWQWLSFSHWGPVPICYYPFHEILEHPHTIRRAERLSPENDIHIELTHGNGRLEFWFDPKVNYLIRKRVMVPAADKKYRWEDEVVDFAEPAPAVFVPIALEHRCFVDGALQAVLRTILSDVKVNQPLAQDALRIPKIAGLECVDFNRNVKFKVDADGNAIGPESPEEVVYVAPNYKQGSGIPTPPYYKDPFEPSKPPTPWWMWMLIASLTVLLTAVIAAIVRRRRQATQT